MTAGSHPALVATLLAERLVDEHEGDGPQRLTLVSPLAQLGCHSGASRSEEPESMNTTEPQDVQARWAPLASKTVFMVPAQACGLPRNDGLGDRIDALALARRDRGARARGQRLPAKFAVVVDGGGESSLEAFAGDLRIVATAPGRVVMALADRLWFGPLAESEAGAVVAQVLARFAAKRAQTPDAIRRMGDLAADELAALTDLPATEAPAARPASRRAGLFALGESHAALVGLPFGRAGPRRSTVSHRRPNAGLPGDPPLALAWPRFSRAVEADAIALLDGAAAEGLITRDDDPRLSVQACAGAPACSRAEAPAMADAARLRRCWHRTSPRG